jgi:hypothetical protein
MNAKEFTEQLFQRYGAPKNQFLMVDIENYFSPMDVDFEKLYRCIVETHEYENFPNLAKVKKIYEEVYQFKSSSNGGGGRDAYFEKVKEISRNMSIPEIVEYVRKIRDRDVERTTIRVAFVVFYEALSFHYNRLLEGGRDQSSAVAYCEKVKESLFNGEKVGFGEPVEGMKTMSYQRTGRVMTFAEASRYL